jgi:ZIP family zinc transporter
MESILVVVLLAAMAGFAMPAGAVLARWENIQPDWLEQEFRHSVIAFGGGALLSAVALVLIPESLHRLGAVAPVLAFVAGGLAFMWLEKWLAGRQTHASQVLAMLSDFVPESLALGALVALGGQEFALLAALMALQNLPEGFNAYRELMDSGALRARRIIGAFVLLALLGPLCAWLGHAFLSTQPQLMAGIMIFAAGGIVYSVFGDIAPQAKLENHYWPPMGAVLGFSLGLFGHQL